MAQFDERAFWLDQRQALLMQVDSIERKLGMERTSDLRKREKNLIDISQLGKWALRYWTVNGIQEPYIQEIRNFVHWIKSNQALGLESEFDKLVANRVQKELKAQCTCDKMALTQET